MREANGKGPYDYKAHRDWCSEFNSGICHIKSMTEDYPISSFCSDVFHGRGGVIKVQLRYVRRIMEGNSRALSVFATYLRNMKHWDGYVVDPWEANDTLQRLKGKYTKEFISNTTDIVTLLKQLIPGTRTDKFCTCLVSFECVHEILGIIIIDNYDDVIEVLRTGNTLLDEYDINEESEPEK